MTQAESIPEALGRWAKETGQAVKEWAVITYQELHAAGLGAFNKRNVLVLGDTASGKTSLIWLLKIGRPYEMVNNQRVVPKATNHVIDLRGRRVNAKFNRWDNIWDEMKRVKTEGGIMFLPRDVGGEYREEWHQLIKSLDPELIIYMVNGTADDTEDKLDESSGLPVPSIRKIAQDIHDDVINLYDHRKTMKLRHFAVFISFRDQWNPSGIKSADAMQRSRLEYAIAKILMESKKHKNFNMDMLSYHFINLYRENDTWPEAKRALKELTVKLGWSK